MFRIFLELIKTEKNFLQAMLALKEVYRDSLLTRRIVEPKLVTKMFSNLDEVRNKKNNNSNSNNNNDNNEKVVSVSFRMYTKMEELSSTSNIIKSVAYLFNEEFESFKVFATFCSNQTIAKDCLQKEKKRNEQFQKFLKVTN